MGHGGIDVLGAARFRRRELAPKHAETGVVDTVGGDNRRAQCGAHAMIASAIRYVGDEIDAVEAGVERRG